MNSDTKVDWFVARKIQRLDTDSPWSRAMLAKLRRGIGKKAGSVPEIWEITIGETPEAWHRHDGEPSYAEQAAHTALTLYAAHRQGKDRSMNASGENGYSFGAAIGKLIRPDGGNEDAVKRRFDAAATAVDFIEFAHHTRGLVQLLKAEDIPFDYPKFAQDLYWYQLPGGADGVRLRWGQDFYRARYQGNNQNQNRSQQ